MEGEQRNGNTPLLDFASALRLTFKSWPVIAGATIGLCYLTQLVAGWFGIELPDQANIELVKRYAGWNWAFVSLCFQVLILMPAIEELIFRLPTRWLRHPVAIVGSSVLFSAAHYLFQPWPDAAFLALFFFGLAQCWIYRKTGKLWCAILNHGLFNLTNLILLFLLPEA